MDFLNPKISRIRQSLCLGMDPNLALLEESKIMFSTVSKIGADNPLRLWIHHNLALHHMTLFLAGIVLSLLIIAVFDLLSKTYLFFSVSESDSP